MQIAVMFISVYYSVYNYTTIYLPTILALGVSSIVYLGTELQGS